MNMTEREVEIDQCCEGRLQHTATCPLLPSWGPTEDDRGAVVGQQATP